MRDTELRRKLAMLIGVRAVIGTTLLGGAIVAQIRQPGSFPINPFMILIALIYALTIIYSLSIAMVERRRWLIDVQLAGDALIVSAFICFTGGVTSVFSPLYVLPIVAASVLQFRRGGLLVATFSTLLYGALVLAQYLTGLDLLDWGWLTTEALPAASVAQFTVALNVLGFYAVALLSGSLAEGVRAAGVRLELASSQIADLQAFNQHVIDSLPSGLVTTDKTQRILTFNPGAEFITGQSLASVIGRPLDEVLQLPSGLDAALDQLEGGKVRRLEYRYRTPDGRGEIEIGLGVAHLETPGARTGLLVTFQDVTNLKRLERDARMQQRLAAVGEMAAGIAHEIRNPLASMSGSIQILRQELALTSEQEQLMDIVLRESERLNTTIRSFLAYARPQRFAIQRFDVSRALHDTALLLRNSSEVNDAHAIDVEAPDGVWFEADEGQIKQIVWNLATNGLRAMPTGGTLRLAAAVGAGTGAVVISVRDEGIGIPADRLDSLFQPFSGSFERGSGLGLAIVHRIVTDYHGEIQVSSQPGSGTTVSVRLPAREPVVAA
jgi:two-component system sensor histidine kinase PilS (NtrC family)